HLDVEELGVDALSDGDVALARRPGTGQGPEADREDDQGYRHPPRRSLHVALPRVVRSGLVPGIRPQRSPILGAGPGGVKDTTAHRGRWRGHRDVSVNILAPHTTK